MCAEKTLFFQMKYGYNREGLFCEGGAMMLRLLVFCLLFLLPVRVLAAPADLPSR